VDRLPRDPALRSVEVGGAPLRLSSEPVPAEAMPLATGNHAARVAAAMDWLGGQCGDYAPRRRQYAPFEQRKLIVVGSHGGGAHKSKNIVARRGDNCIDQKQKLFWEWFRVGSRTRLLPISACYPESKHPF